MKIVFLASARPIAQHALKELMARYGQTSMANADCLVAIGGDGTALRALHATLTTALKPVFAMRTEGSVGFLGDALRTNHFIERVYSGIRTTIYPLRTDIEQVDGCRQTIFGINDIILFRQRFQTANKAGVARISLSPSATR